jgi:aspartate racemase
MHNVAAAIEAAVSIPLLDIIGATAARVRATGLRRVGLLGTRFTMELPFYVDRMASHGVEIVLPSAEDRATVHQVIFGELCHGVISAGARAAYRQVIERLVAGGAEGIILGCTEIELLIGEADSPVRVFPSSRIHVDAALARALADG